jgi:curved DNA-binding protein CbpA
MAETKTCPYETLSIPRTASDEEVKRAYRRLAIVHHPDKNNNSAESTQMFQKISAAYAILSDTDKRQRYDETGCLDEEDLEGPDMGDFSQMFFSHFGGGMMFGGSEMFFEFGGPQFRGGRSYTDPFMDLLGHFVDGDKDEFSDSFDEYDMFMEEFLDVIPALFCAHFIDIEEVVPAAPPADAPRKNKKKTPKEQFKCTLCQRVMKSPEAAENHFMSDHATLVDKFCDVLQEHGMASDIEMLFDSFAKDVKAGKIGEKRKKKKRNIRKRGPRVSAR